MSAQRERKEEKVAKLQTLFSNAKIIVVTHYSGSSMDALTELRQQLGESGGTFHITKNKLALRALEGTPTESIKPFFTGPTAVAISNDEGAVTQISKAIVDFGKKHENLKLLGGAMDGALLEESEVRALASLPSINDLHSKLIGLILQPASKIITILNQPGSKVVRVLTARASAEDSK
jgi:large subunit ribosomal protein L10